MAKRRCTEKTKAGRRCRNNPLPGETYCISHAPRSEKEARGFGGPQPGSGPKRKPTPGEVARQLIEANLAVILRPHFAVLGHDVEVGEEGIALVPLEGGGAKLFGESREGVIKMSSYPDLGAQIAAADKLLDRVYGRPKQVSESKVDVHVKDQMDREIEELTQRLKARSNGSGPASRARRAAAKA